MARESDFNWEDDLMTKWVISLLSLLCGISLSLEQHIYLKQPTNTNKLRSTTNKQTNNQRSGQELPEAGVPPFKASKVSRARLRKTETRLGVRETEHCLSGRQWGYCADVDIFFIHFSFVAQIWTLFYRTERSDQGVCTHVSDGRSVWN